MTKINLLYSNNDKVLSKLYTKAEYYFNKIPKRKENIKYKYLEKLRNKLCDKNNIQLRNHQEILSNFITPNTINNGVLVFHGTGSGKTCLAISICENFKEQAIKYNTKIHIVVPGPDIKKNWYNSILNECAKNTYLNNLNILKDSLSKKEIDNIKKNASIEIRKYYKILTYEKFRRLVIGDKVLNYKRGKRGEKYLKDSKDFIRNLSLTNNIESLNNTILVIDEAHNMIASEKRDSLNKIIKNSVNLRLVLLSATPMRNLASDIIPLINFLKPKNDKLEFDKIFKKGKFVTDLKLKDNALDYIKKCANLVSHYRGADYLTFPIGREKGEIVSPIKYTKIYRCFMQNFQLNYYLQNVKDVKNTTQTIEKNSLYQSIANFVYPILDTNTGEIVGESTIKGIKKLSYQIVNNYDILISKIKKKFSIKDDIELYI